VKNEKHNKKEKNENNCEKRYIRQQRIIKIAYF